MTTTSLADAKNRLSELVASAQKTHERTIITKNGKPAAMLISVEDWEGMEETLEILSDPELMAEIRAAREEIDHGDIVSAEETTHLLAKRQQA
jgi:antitoxin YefM